MIMADELTYPAVIDAMESGNMYASTGPVFHEISVDGLSVHVECSGVSHIVVYNGSKQPYRVHAPLGKTITSADFQLKESDPYIRVSAIDVYGKRADSRGYFRDEWLK